MKILATILIAFAAASARGDSCMARGDVSGLPLVELPSDQAGDRFAVMVTGDGGWRRIDVKVTEPLRDAGIPIVGLLSPDYFGTRRTAEESACALERIIRYYQIRWRRPKVILIGYSRGADVLPFMVSRLPADLRASTELVALLGLEPLIDFRYHPSWIPFYHPRETQYPVQPEVEKLRGMNLVCVYGENEKHSLCPALSPVGTTIVKMPGSHHFGGHYREVAKAIMERLR